MDSIFWFCPYEPGYHSGELKFNLSNWMFIIFEFDSKLFYTIDVLLFVFPKDEPNS